MTEGSTVFTVPRKPWYRARNVAFAALLIVALIIGWFVHEVWKVYTGEPLISHNYRAEFRSMSEKATGVPPGSGAEAWAKLIEAAETYGSIEAEINARRHPDKRLDSPV
jgi:hypothetical protein